MRIQKGGFSHAMTSLWSEPPAVISKDADAFEFLFVLCSQLLRPTSPLPTGFCGPGGPGHFCLVGRGWDPPGPGISSYGNSPRELHHKQTQCLERGRNSPLWAASSHLSPGRRRNRDNSRLSDTRRRLFSRGQAATSLGQGAHRVVGGRYGGCPS